MYSGNNYPYIWLLDEVRIYDRILSDSEVAILYSSSK
jgi:hypothetical protein